MADARTRLRRAAWRRWYGLKWLAWQRRQADRQRTRTLRGIAVRVDPGVLDPGWFFSSEVLVDALLQEVRPGDRVLDLGTGTGIGALASLQAGAGPIIATDPDPVALACARDNLAAAAGSGVEVRDGDLFDPVRDERFDLVAFNPPWLSTADARHRLALQQPAGLAERFAAGLAAHLEPAGRAILVLSTTADEAAWLGPLGDARFVATPLLVRDRGSEVLTAWRLSPG